MPSTPTKHDTLLRQWQMLREIPRYPAKITAGQVRDRLVAAGFDVTKRTVERDLASLSVVFPLLLDDRDKPFGWSWKKDAVPLDVPGLGNGEALAFNLVEQYLQGLLPHAILAQLAPYFRMAGQRLAGLPKVRSVPTWPDKVRVVQPTQALLPPKIDPKVQQTVSDALLYESQLTMRYRRRGEEKTSEFLVHPLALIQRGPITYLVATLFDYTDLRLLALHRIRSAEALEKQSNRPEDFDIDRYIASGALGFGEGKTIRLEVIFNAAAAEHLHETPLSEDQKITPVDDGRVRVTATLVHTAQLEWWLMAFGDNAEVVGPKALRDDMTRIANDIAAKYRAV